MTFICSDCSYRSAKKFPAGKCPACDSFNIKANHKTAETENKPKKTMVQIIVLVLVWLAFIYGVWDRYIKDATHITNDSATQNSSHDKLKSGVEKTLPNYDEFE